YKRQPLDDPIAVETAMAMTDVVRADEVGRLSICADDTCGGVVVDLSRSRSRRFCRTACGNRVSAATHRARRSG
ncbi:CGNR zinc finger domain-containing protein, partial [Pseudonocardia sp. KRD-182]|uniref:CGNR zinc finger domain-containing protein n=1 Tax=Pseudonocardia oceani TaxID=2792013 RepID=UPI001C49DC63